MSVGLETEMVLVKLKKILTEDMDINLEADQITDDMSLLEDGIALDSILLVELITHIESKLNLEFDDADLRVESFTRLDHLAALVTRRIHTQSGC